MWHFSCQDSDTDKRPARKDKTMNILLAGGSNALMNHIIQRLNKEGHKTFLLTGSRYKNEWYDKDVTDNPPAEDEEHGYVVFDGLTLSGVIK